MMKKLMMIATMLVAALTASAQNDNLKNEIGIYYGVGSASGLFSVFSEVFTFATEQDSFWGPVGVEYYHHVTPVVAVGCVASIAGCSWKSGSDTNTTGWSSKYITVMPSVKFNWLRRNHFGMYSSLSAGAMFMSNDIDDNKDYKKSDSTTWFMFQVTPIGAEFGGTAFRGFVEAGLGEKGLLCAGLRYKF